MAKLHPFIGLRFLDLHDHFSAGEHFFSCVDDFSADRAIIIIGLADPGACSCLEHDTVACSDIFARCLRRQSDAIFVVLDLFGHTDEHESLL